MSKLRLSRRDFLKHTGALALLPALADLDRLAAQVTVGGAPLAIQTPRYALHLDLTADQYESRYAALSAQGYRPQWLQGYLRGSQIRYADTWARDGLSAWEVRRDLSADAFQTAITDLSSQGYAPVCVSGYAGLDGIPRFAAVWLKAPGIDSALAFGLDDATFEETGPQMAAAGYGQIMMISGYYNRGAANYAAIWQRGEADSRVTRYAIPAADYQGVFDALVGQGYRLLTVSGYLIGSEPYFAGVWAQDEGADWGARHGLTNQDMLKEATGAAQASYRATTIGGYWQSPHTRYYGTWVRPAREWRVTGQEVPALAFFDEAMRGFMLPRSIPHGALAVTRNGRLVLARGYTWNAEPGDEIQPNALFRIASISKTITATAILRLVQDGLLRIEDKMVDILNPQPPVGRPPDPRLKDVTIRHLFQHLGGWDRDETFDPVFRDETIARALGRGLPISQQDIITYMTGRRLDFTPGEEYQYSNYGYLLLGRIVEAVAGKAYADYVREMIFEPLGIQRTRLGRSLLTARAPGEVLYYSMEVGLFDSVVSQGQVMLPYGAFSMENLDSVGGWISSPVDLVRFASTFDDPASSPVLNADSIATMFAQPERRFSRGGAWYGGGWDIRPARGAPAGSLNMQHNGSLPGTTTLLVRRWNGLNWAVCFNQRDDPSGQGYSDIGTPLLNAASGIADEDWPDHDLFDLYL